MSRNTSVILGDHFAGFVESKIDHGRYESVSEAVRAGLRLLEIEERKLDLLRAKLEEGEYQINQGLGVDGDKFMDELNS